MKILLVDDHNLIRQGIIRLLKQVFPSSEILEAGNGLETLEILKSTPTDLILLDVQMPKMNGMETLKHIKEKWPQSKVIMLTQFDESALVAYCLQLGANAFLLKNGDVNEVGTAISKVLKEGHYFSPFVMKIIRKRQSKISELANLDISPIEFQLLCILKEGHSSKTISEKLGLTKLTVDSYRKELLRKTKTKNVAELVSLSYRCGLIPTS
jgi:two-component system response regulator DegU